MMTSVDRPTGIWCVLRIFRRHIVLMRPNPAQFGHLGFEIMMGVRLATRFRAPLWIIRPADVVSTALYDVVTDGVRIRVFQGRWGELLKWAFFDTRLQKGGPRKDKPVAYGSPLHFLLEDRAHWPTPLTNLAETISGQVYAAGRGLGELRGRAARRLAPLGTGAARKLNKLSRRAAKRLRGIGGEPRRRFGKLRRRIANSARWFTSTRLRRTATVLMHNAEGEGTFVQRARMRTARTLCRWADRIPLTREGSANVRDAAIAAAPDVGRPPSATDVNSESERKQEQELERHRELQQQRKAAKAAAMAAPPVDSDGFIYKKRTVLHTYVKRLWIDQVPSFHVPASRLPALEDEAEKVLGVSSTAPLVTLHLRESGFKAGREIHERKPASRINDSTRNVSFANYRSAIDHLHARGYVVVRIGDPSMVPIRYPGLIDLATSPGRTDLLEFYCVQRSDFFIGCESGASMLAWMCRKPALILNATEPLSASFPVRETDIFTLKRVLDKQSGRMLGPLDMLSRDYLNNSRNPGRFEYFENSAEDVLAAVEEMLAIIEQGLPPETPEQREFRLRAIAVGVRSRLENSTVRKHGPHHGFLGRGRLAAGFARKYCEPTLGAGRPDGKAEPEFMSATM